MKTSYLTFFFLAFVLLIISIGYPLHRMWKEYREGDVIQKDHELSETTSYRQVIQDYS